MLMIPLNCALRVVISMRTSKESSRFFSVETVALQNLPQTFRGRERSKRGYASRLLLTVTRATNHGRDRGGVARGTCVVGPRPNPRACGCARA